MTPAELYEGFLALVENNDETGARAFLIAHLNEFPEEMKEKIAFAFFTEAAIKTGNEVAAIANLQKEGLRLLSELDEQEKILDEAESAHALKEGLN